MLLNTDIVRIWGLFQRIIKTKNIHGKNSLGSLRITWAHLYSILTKLVGTFFYY